MKCSIDFMCFPNFDSPSIFAAFLYEKKGGSFELKPAFVDMKTKQLYLPDTNVLLTRFLSSEGVGEITDFMPVEELFDGKELIRRVTTVRGEVTYKMRCSPRFNYGRSLHSVENLNETEIKFTCADDPNIVLKLKSSVPIEIKDGDACAEFTLSSGQTADFLLEHVDANHTANKDFQTFITESLFKTVNYWKDWIGQSAYPWQVVRDCKSFGPRAEAADFI